MSSSLPTGAVTFLFTDIQGSTPLWEHEPDRMRLALARHHAILREATEAHDGRVYKIIGDAFQAAFAFPAQAVEAALPPQWLAAAQPELVDLLDPAGERVSASYRSREK